MIGIDKVDCITNNACNPTYLAYFEAVLYPSNLVFRSAESAVDELEMHLYVPRTTVYADVTLYVGGEILGSFSLSLFKSFSLTDVPLMDDGWCPVEPFSQVSKECNFTRNMVFRKKGWWFENVLLKPAVVNGYLVTGQLLYSKARGLHMRGIAPIFDDVTENGIDIVPTLLPVDGIENHINYAKTGSPFPASLHGLFWMDQRGMNLPTPYDPEYKQVCASAADEIVVSFGEANWDEDKNCVTDVGIFSGGPLWGHWTFFDQGGATSDAWDGAGVHRPVADFCFKDGTRKNLDIWRRFKIGNLPVVPDHWDISMTFPHHIMHLEMDRTNWGWDRVTTVVNVGSLALLECHYPVWQIVDGSGKRTEHYDAYVEWATNVSTCETSDFLCHKNINTEGKMIMPRAQSDLCGYAVRGAVRRNSRGIVPTGAFCKCSRGMKIIGDNAECHSVSRKFDPKDLAGMGCRCAPKHGGPLPSQRVSNALCSRAAEGAERASGGMCACAEGEQLVGADPSCKGSALAPFDPFKFSGKQCGCETTTGV
jgi:Amt family ammonium transporter